MNITVINITLLWELKDETTHTIDDRLKDSNFIVAHNSVVKYKAS